MFSTRSIIYAAITLGTCAATWCMFPRYAGASICATPHLDGVFPHGGSKDVPINTRVWVPGLPSITTPEDLRLQIENGPFSVAKEVTELRVQSSPPDVPYMYVLKPEQLLEAETQYKLFVRGILKGTFTTGRHSDHEAPDRPQVQQQKSFHYITKSYGDRYFGARFELDHTGIFTLLDNRSSTDFDAIRLQGQVGDIDSSQYLYFGHAYCNFNWPIDTRHQSRDRATARFGAMDIAGNFSGWTEDYEVVIPPQETDASCSLAAATSSDEPSSSWAWITILITAFSLRGRHQPFGKPLKSAFRCGSIKLKIRDQQ